MDIRNLADLYGLPALDWSAVVARLDAGIRQAPGTAVPIVTPAGSRRWTLTAGRTSPRSEPCGWTAPSGSRRGSAPAREGIWRAIPRCALSVATSAFDLVVEGNATKVTDPAAVAKLARCWADEGWPCRVDESGLALTAEYSAPSAGPPPWSVYRITARGATAMSTVEPGGATRWTF